MTSESVKEIQLEFSRQAQQMAAEPARRWLLGGAIPGDLRFTHAGMLVKAVSD